MPYELTIATRPNPDDRPGRKARPTPTVSTVVLSGTLDEHASKAVLATVAKAGVEGANSIVVEFHDVIMDDTLALDTLTSGIMSLRDNGAEVQVSVLDDALHARMASLPHARDWLLSRASVGPALPRKALHVDASNGTSPKA